MNKQVISLRFWGILMVLALIAASAACMLLLWNALMPDIFGLPVLNYWQAAGLLVLCRILFGGIGLGHFIPGGKGRDHGHYGNKLREKWMHMTEEERKAFIEKEKGFHRFFHDRFAANPHRFYEAHEQKDGQGESAASSKGEAGE
ncbi:MAG: hypothetical protein LBC51_03170 [Treponema sp.]|jgi:hypothetical protein|nr:hypothetical protein [Treponema sp.]